MVVKDSILFKKFPFNFVIKCRTNKNKNSDELKIFQEK